MSFGQDFLKGFFGADSLRDYKHASKTFRPNGYELSPRNKFLFHVSFNLNFDIPALRSVFQVDEQAALGLVVKSVTLPSYDLNVETMNQYNRKRLIQNRINYNPVTIVFHDDTGDHIRNLWYNYYSYHYKDPTQKYRNLSTTDGTSGNSSSIANGFSYNSRDIYSNRRQVNDWGFIGEGYQDASTNNMINNSGKPPFFRDIVITGFAQHKVVQYVLINPLIKSWQHDTYDYAQGAGTMQNTMQVMYETVKYIDGAVSGIRPDTNVFGFADPNRYDIERSPLARAGSTATVLGQGGLLDTGIGIVSDLQSRSVAGVLGAVQKAGTAYQTFKGRDLRAVVKEEAVGSVKEVLRNTTTTANRPWQNRDQSIVIPTPPKGVSPTSPTSSVPGRINTTLR
jgi:hypothetical protein